MLNPLQSVTAAGRQRQRSPSYYWPNHDRKNTGVILQLTLSGYCCFRYRETEWTVGPGQAFVAIPPEDSAYWYPREAKEAYETVWINAAGMVSEACARHLRQAHGPVLALSAASRARDLLLQLVELRSRNRFPDRFTESAYLYRLWMLLEREQAYREQAKDPVALAYHTIHNHFRSPFNIKELAQRSGISREHLTRQFRQRYGITPAAMLENLRFEAARHQLASHHSLRAIAASCGLVRERNLSRLFLRRTGQSPRRAHS